jgi:hypothetical protein
MTSINDFNATYMCQGLPFGGVKYSGFGRFAGVEGLRALCIPKVGGFRLLSACDTRERTWHTTGKAVGAHLGFPMQSPLSGWWSTTSQLHPQQLLFAEHGKVLSVCACVGGWVGVCVGGWVRACVCACACASARARARVRARVGTHQHGMHGFVRHIAADVTLIV